MSVQARSVLTTWSFTSATLIEIEAWLTAHGKAFRLGLASPEAALARAIGLIEAIVEGIDQEAFLKAFVALPELRRSLSLAA